MKISSQNAFHKADAHLWTTSRIRTTPGDLECHEVRLGSTHRASSSALRSTLGVADRSGLWKTSREFTTSSSFDPQGRFFSVAYRKL
jgi:hypothetical protein